MTTHRDERDEQMDRIQLEAAIQADLLAPLCIQCEAMDVYDRSPESCAGCAAIRVAAVLATAPQGPSLPHAERDEKLADAIDRLSIAIYAGRPARRELRPYIAFSYVADYEDAPSKEHALMDDLDVVLHSILTAPVSVPTPDVSTPASEPLPEWVQKEIASARHESSIYDTPGQEFGVLATIVFLANRLNGSTGAGLDTALLDALDNACRQIDLRFNEGTPKKCYRWQVETWGDAKNRPSVRDAIRETFGPLLADSALDALPPESGS